MCVLLCAVVVLDYSIDRANKCSVCSLLDRRDVSASFCHKDATTLHTALSARNASRAGADSLTQAHARTPEMLEVAVR